MKALINKFKKSKENNKYKYKVYFENKQTIEGTMEVESLDVVYKVLMLDRFTQLENNTKAFYYNINKINHIEVCKVEEET